jgi:hypothetical protein
MGETVAKCTFSTMQGGESIPDETTIWATGPAGMIAPSLHVLLSNYQACAGEACFICSTLGSESYQWKLKSILKSYQPATCPNEVFKFACSSHGSHTVMLNHGVFKMSQTASSLPVSLPASQAVKLSTCPEEPYRSILVLYESPGHGQALFREAFGMDDNTGCVFEGEYPVVCRLGDTAEKIRWDDVTSFLSNSKKPYPQMLMQSDGMESDQCVTSLEQLKEGVKGVVDVWVPAAPRTSYIQALPN